MINKSIPEWISNPNGLSEEAVQYTEELGKLLCMPDRDKRISPMTTSQIRNIFGEVKRIQAKGLSKEKSSFVLLKPKIAYAEARVKAKSGNSRISNFREAIELAHSAVKDDESRFQNFVDFFEAILAYHKAAGGRES